MNQVRKDYDNYTAVTQYTQAAESQAAASITTSSSTTTRDTAPGVLKPWDKMLLLEQYEKIMGEPMNMTVGAYLGELFRDGVEIEVVLYALEETAWARRPTPHYMRAILRRVYGANGVRTAAELHEFLLEEEAARDRRRQRSAWQDMADELPF